jgi:hypothetical protein
MRRFAAIAGLGLALALPGSAFAKVELTQFSVEPTSRAAGGHPNVTITQALGYDSAADDVKDAFVRLPPGMLGNPQAAAVCTPQQFAADACPDASVVGSVVVNANLALLPDLLPTLPAPPVNGVVYNLPPAGSEPARLGLVLAAIGGLSKIFLQAPVELRPGPDGYALESTFADQPRESAGLNIQIQRIALTFNGAASRGPFMRMPTTCAPLRAVSRVNSHDAPGASSERSFELTATNCDALPFSPTASGSVGAAGMTHKRDNPPVTTTLRFDPEHAALKSAEVTLPIAIAPNLRGLRRACSREQANASACPDSSRVGTAIIDSPLQAQPVRGPIYIAFNTPAVLPGLLVMLPPPVGVRLDGASDATPTGLKNVFASNPDLPVRSFTLALDSGEDGLFELTQNLCDERTDTTMDVSLVAHSGKRVSFKQPLATPGCDPLARLAVRRKGRRAKLVARLQAAREGPAITSATLRLPKKLRRGKRAPSAFVGGRRTVARGRGRNLRVDFPGDGVRGAVIVWRGLRASRKLRRTTAVTITMSDTRGKLTTLKPRAEVRGKRSRRG